MPIPRGTECFNADCSPVIARGLVYSEDELETALGGPVLAILRDDAGNEVLSGLLTGVAETEFQKESVGRILSYKRIPEDWRVGEAIAESYLNVHRACIFPWPAGRDKKNPESSQPGADLVGFQHTDDTARPHRFAFGEVKTSSERRWPPQVMYGRHGMVRQIESLRDNKEVKDHLVRYLGHRILGTGWRYQYNKEGASYVLVVLGDLHLVWQNQFLEAASRYLADPTDVSLFGVLVRDVEPRASDLRNRAETLASDCPEQTSIELTAIYLPENSIPGIGNRTILNKEG